MPFGEVGEAAAFARARHAQQLDAPAHLEPVVQPQLDRVVVDAQPDLERLLAREQLHERRRQRRREMREVADEAVGRRRELKRRRREHLAFAVRRPRLGVEPENIMYDDFG